MQFNNKVVVITGAGNGMGREMALLILAKGAKVAGVDLKENFLQETKSLAGENGANFVPFPMDITDQAAVDLLPQKVKEQFGAIDALMNVAGIIQPFVPVQSLDDKTIERVMNVNFFGTVHLCRAFLPELLKRPEAYILNVSSMGGFLPVPGQSIYGASKAAVKLFTEGLSAELAGTSVGVSLVFPGGVGTAITQNSGVSMPSTGDAGNYKMLSAPAAAAIMVAAVEKNKFRVIVGSDASFMDKLVRLAPEYAKNLIRKKMAFLIKPS